MLPPIGPKSVEVETKYLLHTSLGDYYAVKRISANKYLATRLGDDLGGVYPALREVKFLNSIGVVQESVEVKIRVKES